MKIDIHDDSLAGEHDLILSIGFKDYPNNYGADSNTFKAIIHKVAKPIVGDITYTVFSEPLKI